MVLESSNDVWSRLAAGLIKGLCQFKLTFLEVTKLDWKVDDYATATFMESFYKRLKAGEGRANVLAATQKEFRNHPTEDWQHPYVWAAFQLSGDWRPVENF